MRGFLFTIAILCINFLSAQKIVEKSVLNTTISLVNIDAENCFKITLETAKTNVISATATIDGEYQKDLALQITEDGSTIFISAGFNPNFINPNDKLSAHKVVSIALHIIVPNYMTVKLFGRSANINATGKYKYLNISLSDGFCKLKNITDIITVKTQSGPIYLESNKATITATSKYGEINAVKIPKGNTIFNLSSVTGNIHLSKSK